MSGASKRDREKLRERVKTELRKQSRSQKELEEAAGLASGTLTRVFNGRRALDAEVAELLVRELGLPGSELFAGTSFLAEFGGEGAEDERAAEAPAAVAPPRAEQAIEKPATAVAASTTAERQPAVVSEPAPTPSPRVAAAPPPAQATARAYEPPPPPPEPEPRSRKRDIPLKAVRFLVGMVFGRD